MQLDRTGSGTLALINGMRYIRLGNIGFISCIINDDCPHLVRIINPFLKLRLGNG